MAQWEYLVKKADAEARKVETKSGEQSLNDYLDAMGLKGWELIAVAPLIDTNMGGFGPYTFHLLYFKRIVDSK